MGYRYKEFRTKRAKNTGMRTYENSSVGSREKRALLERNEEIFEKLKLLFIRDA